MRCALPADALHWVQNFVLTQWLQGYEHHAAVTYCVVLSATRLPVDDMHDRTCRARACLTILLWDRHTQSQHRQPCLAAYITFALRRAAESCVRLPSISAVHHDSTTSHRQPPRSGHSMTAGRHASV